MIDDPKTTNAETETAYETVRGAVTGDDAPMEDDHKVASAVLVGATYPVVLIMLLIVGLVVAYFTAWRTSEVREHSLKGSLPEVVRVNDSLTT